MKYSRLIKSVENSSLTFLISIWTFSWECLLGTHHLIPKIHPTNLFCSPFQFDGNFARFHGDFACFPQGYRNRYNLDNCEQKTFLSFKKRSPITEQLQFCCTRQQFKFWKGEVNLKKIFLMCQDQTISCLKAKLG